MRDITVILSLNLQDVEASINNPLRGGLMLDELNAVAFASLGLAHDFSVF